MSSHSSRVVLVCGGESGTGPEREDQCPSPLHDWPLPKFYPDATEEAAWRLRNRWADARCARCGLYGWRPGKLTAQHRRRAVSDV